MNHNVLITSVGQRVALVRCFQDTLRHFFAEAKVYSTDMNPEYAPAAYISDGCFKVSRVTDSQYIDQLKMICIDNKIGMIVPTIDTELLILAEHKSDFEEMGVFVSISSREFISICRDKRNTGAFFEQHNIRVPKSIDKNNPSFPFFAKPYDGSLSTNLHIVMTPDELTKELVKDPKLLFMEYIDSNIYKEYTVDMYYGLDNKVKCIVPRERIKIRAGEINKGITEKKPLTQFLYDRLETIAGCVGSICLQVFLNPDTCDVIGIEINPRFGGGYPLAYAAGANYAEFLIRELFLGEQLEYTDNWKDHLLMLRYDDAVFV
jgi:carbamoyl-phosphate synthase large subunit